MRFRGVESGGGERGVDAAAPAYLTNDARAPPSAHPKVMRPG